MTNRSFVIRKGRLTSAQGRALIEDWSDYGIDLHEGQLIDLEGLFPFTYNKIIVEIGFGNGDSLLEMAMSFPGDAFIGIEVYPSGVGRILAKIREKQLNNLRIIRADAAQVIRENFADNSLDRIQIYFPDPWQKLRHHKRRLVQKDFCDILHRKLNLSGVLHLATDWQNYAESMRDIFLDDEKWQNLGNTDGFAAKPDYRPETKFERRGRNLGHDVWDLLFAKR